MHLVGVVSVRLIENVMKIALRVKQSLVPNYQCVGTNTCNGTFEIRL
jgi:hypothetical protein